MAKELTPSSEYTLWNERFANEWHEPTVLNYEFALLRRTVIGLAQAEPELGKVLLQRILKDAPKEWDWMTPEEQAQATEAAKARARQFRGS